MLMFAVICIIDVQVVDIFHGSFALIHCSMLMFLLFAILIALLIIYVVYVARPI